MSTFKAPAISIDSLEDIKAIKEYLRDLTKKIRFLSENIESDNLDPAEYKKLYEDEERITKFNYSVEELSLEVQNKERDISAKLKQSAEEIKLLLAKGSVTNQVNVSSEKIYISGNKLRVKSENFNLDDSGNVSIKGEVFANEGYLGEFNIKKENENPYLLGGTGTVIDSAGLKGTTINCKTLNITTDRDITGCSINFSNCVVNSSKKTYMGWFQTEDVKVSGTIYAICAYIDGDVSCTGHAECYDVWSENENLAWSDRRLKEDIRRLDEKKALDYLMKLRPVSFRFKDSPGESIQYGLIAQDVLKVGDPYHIVTKRGGRYSIAYGKLNAVVAAALKEQKREMEELCLY